VDLIEGTRRQDLLLFKKRVEGSLMLPQIEDRKLVAVVNSRGTFNGPNPKKVRALSAAREKQGEAVDV